MSAIILNCTNIQYIVQFSTKIKNSFTPKNELIDKSSCYNPLCFKNTNRFYNTVCAYNQPYKNNYFLGSRKFRHKRRGNLGGTEGPGSQVRVLFCFIYYLKGQGHEIRMAGNWYSKVVRTLGLIFLTVPLKFYSSFKFLSRVYSSSCGISIEF